MNGSVCCHGCEVLDCKDVYVVMDVSCGARFCWLPRMRGAVLHSCVCFHGCEVLCCTVVLVVMDVRCGGAQLCLFSWM